MDRALKLELHSSIKEIGESRWDSILQEKHFFHSYRFVSAVEDAKVMNARFSYLLFLDGERLVASAVLSEFEVGLDIFLGKSAKAVIGLVRTLFPGFMKIRILFAGLPVSIGKYNLVVSAEETRPTVARTLLAEMASIALSRGVSFLCVKEFPEKEDFFRKEIVKAGYLVLDSLPYGTLDIRWDSFSDYLGSFKHRYRRLIKKSLCKLDCTEPRIKSPGQAFRPDDGPSLVLERGELVTLSRLYKQYLQVMERARVKLEVLNEAFFGNIIEYMPERVELLSFIHGEKVFGSAIVVTSGKRMTFLLIGLDYCSMREWDVYFNIMYGIVSIAISRNCEVLDMGQTSEYAKQRLGTRFVPEYFYLKSSNRVVHALLRLTKGLMFPRQTVPEISVFKERRPRVT